MSIKFFYLILNWVLLNKKFLKKANQAKTKIYYWPPRHSLRSLVQVPIFQGRVRTWCQLEQLPAPILLPFSIPAVAAVWWNGRIDRRLLGSAKHWGYPARRWIQSRTCCPRLKLDYVFKISLVHLFFKYFKIITSVIVIFHFMILF